MSFHEFRKRYVPKKAWIPVVLLMIWGFPHKLPLDFMIGCLWIAFFIAWRARKEQFPIEWESPDWWKRIRWWGIYEIKQNGWYVTKGAWVPPIAFVATGLALNGAIGVLAGAMFGVPWLALYVFLYELCVQELNPKYPITQDEAWEVAGYRTTQEAVARGGWSEYWRIICLCSFGGPLSVDPAGNIIPGRYALDPLRAKQGLRQARGYVIDSNEYLLRNGPFYDNAWISYNTRHSNGQVDPPKHYGIAPQPSIPK